MKVLKILGLFILAIVALFLIIPLFLANSYSVEKSIEIKAEKAIVQDYMKHFSNFDNWSPWSEMDPDMEIEITGVDGTVGAEYYWKGNDDVGEGKMQIAKITDNEIKIDLTFIEPFEAKSPTVYKFSDSENGTTVSWYMEGEMSYPWNVFMIFMDMEEAIGKDFDHGLKRLKSAIEND
jgi:hypothetical protein